MKKKLMLLLAGAVLLVACSGGGEEQNLSGAGQKLWETGEELTQYLDEKLYVDQKIQRDLYIEGRDPSDQPEIVSYEEGKEGVPVQLSEELVYNSSRLYTTYSLPNIKEEENRELYEQLGTGQQLIVDHLDREEFVQAELLALNQVRGYSGLPLRLEGKDYMTLLPTYKELTDYKVLFAQEDFQQKLLDSGLDINNLAVYPINQLGLLDLSGLLFTDGVTEQVYTREINYIRSGPWMSILRLEGKELTLEEGLYPAKAIVDLGVQEMDFLRQQGVYIDGQDDDYYRQLSLAPPVKSAAEVDGQEEMPHPKEEETEAETEDETLPVELGTDISAPDESMTGGTPLTNPGIPDGAEEGFIDPE